MRTLFLFFEGSTFKTESPKAPPLNSIILRVMVVSYEVQDSCTAHGMRDSSLGGPLPHGIKQEEHQETGKKRGKKAKLWSDNPQES